MIISGNTYKKRQIGVGVIGSGRIGTHRAKLAALHSAVKLSLIHI